MLGLSMLVYSDIHPSVFIAACFWISMKAVQLHPVCLSTWPALGFNSTHLHCWSDSWISRSRLTSQNGEKLKHGGMGFTAWNLSVRVLSQEISVWSFVFFLWCSCQSSQSGEVRSKWLLVTIAVWTTKPRDAVLPENQCWEEQRGVGWGGITTLTPTVWLPRSTF